MKNRIAWIVATLVLATLLSTAQGQDSGPLRVSALDWLPVQAMREITAEFEAETGIQVIYETLPYQNLRERQVTEFVAGTGAFDIVHYDVPWIVEYTSYLEPWDGRVDASGLDLDGIVDAIASVHAVNGVPYGFPVNTDALMLYYRSDLFEDMSEKQAFEAEYGYELAPPETWAQFHDIAEFFTRDTDGDGRTDFWGTTLQGGVVDPIWTEWISVFWSWGGEIFDEDGSVTINSEAGVESLEFYAGLFREGLAPPDAPRYGFDETIAAMQQGRVAMSINWIFAAPLYEDPGSLAAGNIGYSLIPREVTHATYLGGFGMGVARDSNQQELAFEYLTWLMHPDQQRKLSELGSVIPRASLLTDPGLNVQYPFYEFALPVVEGARPAPRILDYARVAEIVGTAASDALTGQATATEALNRAAQELERVRR